MGEVRAAGDPWVDWGGQGEQVVLGHANGFPPGCYRALIEALRPHFRVLSFASRPLVGRQPPAELRSWQELAEDLVHAVDQRGLRGAVAVGHSLGGYLDLLAAADDPGLFRAIVAVDPIMLTGWPGFTWGWMKRLGLQHRLALVRGARRRRDRWASREALAASYRSKRVFATWRPGILDDYLESGFQEAADGSVRLRYSKEWEARIFELSPHNPWPAVRRLRVPSLFVRGGDSDTLSRAAAARLPDENPLVQVAEVAGSGHFIPMEQPERAAEIVAGFVASPGVTPLPPAGGSGGKRV